MPVHESVYRSFLRAIQEEAAECLRLQGGQIDQNSQTYGYGKIYHLATKILGMEETES